jgi:hypothetical protein
MTFHVSVSKVKLDETAFAGTLTPAVGEGIYGVNVSALIHPVDTFVSFVTTAQCASVLIER